MNIFKKRFLALFVLIAFAFVCIGCGGNEIDEEFELITEQQLRDYDGKIEIDFRVPSGIIATALKGIIADFNKLWDGKIEVELLIEASGYDGVRSTTNLDLNSKSAPTVVLGYPDHFAEYYSGDYILNLEPYIKEEGDSFNLSDFIPSYLEENRIADNSNDLYGLPFNKSTEVMTYNKTVFDAMGYDVPTTWQGVVTLSEQIIKDVKDGKLDNISGITFSKGEKKPSELLASGQFYPVAYDSTENAFITMCRQWNAEYTGKDDIEHGYVLFNNENCKAGLEYFQNLAKNKIYSVAETFDANYASDAFQLMKCLMTIGSSAGVSYNTNTKFRVGIAKAPYNADNEEGKYVIQQGTNICILNQSTNYQRGAAWQLLKYLTSTEVNAKFCVEADGYVPVRSSGYEATEYVEFLNNPPLDKINYSASAKIAISYSDEGYKFFFDPAFVGSSDVREAVGILMSKVIVSGENIKTAIEDVIDELGPSYQR